MAEVFEDSYSAEALANMENYIISFGTLIKDVGSSEGFKNALFGMKVMIEKKPRRVADLSKIYAGKAPRTLELLVFSREHIPLIVAEIKAHEFKNVKADVGIHGDLKSVIQELVKKIGNFDRSSWFNQIQKWQSEVENIEIINKSTKVYIAAQAIKNIWEGTEGNAVVVSDVGQHQMLEAQYYEHNEPRTLITSGGLGTMGFALPAGIGAYFAQKDKEIWVVVGDGGIQMTLMELATAVQENININIAIINNGYLGMVRQWQQLFYDSRYSETPIYSPDYVKLAEAYRLPGHRVFSEKEALMAIKEVRKVKGPV